MSTSSPATPCTPEPVTPRRIAMTRSFTVPPKLTVSTGTNATPEIGAAEGIETLYVHPRANIIKFTTGGSRPSSSSGSPLGRGADNAGTLPWAYPTESTVAAGPMEIYRVPGSVSFLHSGALLHAILPRSQCWCVDGVSKFAFRVLPETYYRIELPGETAEDLEMVEALKVTLKKVLFYERTPCPFARGFTVELPKEEVKIKKSRSVREGPAKKWRLQKAYSWKPEGWEEEERKRKLDAGEARSSGEDESEESDEEGGASSSLDVGGNTKVPLDPQPEGVRSMRSATVPTKLQMGSIPPSRVRSRVQAVETVDRAEKAEKVRFTDEVNRRSSIRASRMSTIPVDMPPSPPDSNRGMEVQSSGDSSDDDNNLEDRSLDTADGNIAGESAVVDTENDVSAPSDMDGSRPGMNDECRMRDEEASGRMATPAVDARNHMEDIPEHESEALDEHVGYDEDKDKASLTGQLARTQLLEESQNEGAAESEDDIVETAHTKRALISEHATVNQSSSDLEIPSDDPYAAIQARIQERRSIGGAATSFQPSSKAPVRKSTASTSSKATIASQRPSKVGATQRHHSMTAALVNKACSVFLGPPAHLVTMMLRIAARFSSGAFGSNSMFLVESPVGSPRRVPGSFYLEDEDRPWKSDDEEWEEDDFGVPLKSPVRISGVRERARREGWELE